MRLITSLFLGLLTLASAPVDALSASSTLSKLSARVAAAEKVLMQIQSQSHVQNMPTPIVGYNFNGGYFTDLTGANAATKSPSGATNIQIVSNNARTNMVLQRTASNSQTNSKLIIPKGLAETFTVATWISWGQNGGGTILASGSFSLSITSGGIVSATADGLTVTDPTALHDFSWVHYAVTYDGSNLALYRNGRDPAVGFAENGSPFIPTSQIVVANNEAGTSGYIGSIDDIRIYNIALESVEIGFVYSETNFGATKGAAVIQNSWNRWWGHIGTDTKVVFGNRIALQSTQDITITNTFIDATLRTSNLLWIRMFGVTGSAVTAVNVPGVGTVSWYPTTYMLIIQPETEIPQGQSFTYTIPHALVPLNNPTISNAATSSDSRWQIAVTLDADQTNNRSQGLKWQSIIYTPATIDPNPAFIEQDN